MENKLERLLLLYGMIPMLIVLQRKENEENFELCQEIIKVLKKFDCHTSLTEQTIVDMKICCMAVMSPLMGVSITGDGIYKHRYYYANIIEDELK